MGAGPLNRGATGHEEGAVAMVATAAAQAGCIGGRRSLLPQCREQAAASRGRVIRTLRCGASNWPKKASALRLAWCSHAA